MLKMVMGVIMMGKITMRVIMRVTITMWGDYESDYESDDNIGG